MGFVSTFGCQQKLIVLPDCKAGVGFVGTEEGKEY